MSMSKVSDTMKMTQSMMSVVILIIIIWSHFIID